jgi:copper(I)-binding protein
MRRIAIGVLAALAAASCARAAPAVSVEKPEVRASLGNTPTAAAYLTIRNRGDAPDRLVGASCACAGMVMAHKTVTAANGVASMSHEPAVAVPARGTVVFQPGGLHLMMTGLKAPIRAGQKVTITLRFEKAGTMPVVFTAVDTPSAGRP